MVIQNSTNQIQIVDNGVTTSIYKDEVASVEAYLSRYLRIMQKTGYNTSQWAKIKYSDVTSPSSSSLDNLVELVRGYLNQSVTFSVTSGQTTFDCDGYFTLNDNFYAIVNGQRQTWNTSRSLNVATVADVVEGDQVIIVQPR